MRCDVNLSLRKPGDPNFGVRTEIKNINSLSFIQKAVMAEAERQADILDAGGTVVQQTMRYDEATNTVTPMRDKENSEDYRYFPDPDILRFCIDEEKVEEIRASLPELPFAKLRRYVNELGLPEATAKQLSRYRRVAEFFEGALAEGASVKNAANLIVGTIFSNMDTEEEKELFGIKISPAQFAALVKLADEKKINIGVAQSTLQKMLESGKSVEEFIKPEDLVGISDEELESLCKEAIDANPKAVADVRSGKDKAINVMFGYIMKKTGGKADIRKAEALLRKLIGQ